MLLFCCPSTAVTILLICQIAQFEVPASVRSNFFVVRTYFFAVHATFLLSVYFRNNSVNLSNPRGPRQRLVEKWLCPRSTDVDYLLLRISFEKNGRGKCCWPGPSRRTHHVAAESAPVNFCQFSNPAKFEVPASVWSENRNYALLSRRQK
jgi:hypothetical protein